MHTVFIEVLEGMVITGKRNDMFVIRRLCIFLKERTHLTRLVCPLAVITGSMNTDVVADDDPWFGTSIKDRVCPVILFATRQEIRR